MLNLQSCLLFWYFRGSFSWACRKLFYFFDLLCSAYIIILFDLSNGFGFGVGIGLGFGLRNICEGCFKTTMMVNKHKSYTQVVVVL